MERVKLLHIGDLHYTKTKKRQQKIVLDAFHKDIKHLKKSGISPDAVIFSGDLVNNPDETDAFYESIDALVVPLLDQLSLDADRVFFVPGNHEVHRSTVERLWSQQVGIEQNLNSREKLNEWYINQEDLEFVHAKTNGFHEFSQLFGDTFKTKRNLFFTTVYLRQFDTAIALINTSWLSVAGHKQQNDKGRLLFPEQALRDAAESLPDASLKVLVGHHPIDWFAEVVQDDFRNIISRYFDVYMTGHLHASRPQQFITPQGSSFQNQVGALFMDRERLNSYAILEALPGRKAKKVIVRTYFDEREAFAEGVNLSEDGVFFPSEKDKEDFRLMPEQASTHSLKEWVETHVKPTLEPVLNEAISDRPLCNVFVEPPIRAARVESDDNSDTGEDTEKVAFETVCHSSSNFLVYGKPEYGKTTLLKQVGYQVLQETDAERVVIPLLLNFEDIKPGSNRVIRTLRSYLPDEAPSGVSLKTLLSTGQVLLLVDDVDFRDVSRVRLLQDFINNYPQVRYVVTAEQNIMETMGITANLDVSVPFNHVRIEPIGRSGLRSLVQKWDANGGLNEEAILDRIVSDFVHINLPFTAVNGTILLTIFESRTDFTPINRAVLVERFVETLLEKK